LLGKKSGEKCLFFAVIYFQAGFHPWTTITSVGNALAMFSKKMVRSPSNMSSGFTETSPETRQWFHMELVEQISGGFISENFRWVHRDITRILSNRFNRWKNQIGICWTNFRWVSSKIFRWVSLGKFPVGSFQKISGEFTEISPEV
jgi:hypothetical protein